MSVVANRYAEAFFELAVELNAVDKYQSQMNYVDETLFSINETKAFFNAEKISKEDKKKLIRDAYKNVVDENCLNLLYLLIDKKRINQGKSVIKEFTRLCNESKGIKEGYVYSSFPLDEKSIRRIEDALDKRDLKVKLINKIDKSLISGFKVVIDDEVIDASMKNQIEQLTSELYKKRM